VVFVAITGRDFESDASFRFRRLTELNNATGGTEPGVHNAIRGLNEDNELAQLTYIKVVSNRSNSVDAAGRQPHSQELIVSDTAEYDTLPGTASMTFNTNIITVTDDLTGLLTVGDIIAIASDISFGKEKLSVSTITPTTITTTATRKGTTGTNLVIERVTNGLDQKIVNKLLDATSAGIEFFGDMQILATDSFDNTLNVNFNHPIAVPIYLELDLSVSEGLTIDEQQDIIETIVDWGNNLGIGKDVVVFGYDCLVAQFKNSKIKDVTVRVGRVINPTGDNNVIISDGTSAATVEYSYWKTTNVTISNIVVV